jgi:hypothetical protein
LRKQRDLFEKQGVEDAVKSMKSHAKLLEVVNKELVPRYLANDESEDCALGGSIETEEVILLVPLLEKIAL